MSKLKHLATLDIVGNPCCPEPNKSDRHKVLKEWPDIEKRYATRSLDPPMLFADDVCNTNVGRSHSRSLMGLLLLFASASKRRPAWTGRRSKTRDSVPCAGLYPPDYGIDADVQISRYSNVRRGFRTGSRTRIRRSWICRTPTSKSSSKPSTHSRTFRCQICHHESIDVSDPCIR